MYNSNDDVFSQVSLPIFVFRNTNVCSELGFFSRKYKFAAVNVVLLRSFTHGPHSLFCNSNLQIFLYYCFFLAESVESESVNALPI